ncbi:MAG: toll/interleukin-1 receptor domain-containing protein [Saprospiraceae bacterium]|nr:toll/interleukin-1 receptor domain-containing protein [Saprospiraceae bacterium]
MSQPKKIFISYSHNQTDRPLLDQLLKQLAPLVRSGSVTVWEDSQILSGQEWEPVIKEKLAEADIIVMLVSSDYFASDYINRVEVPMAMNQQAEGRSQVVPVLLRPCLFDLMPYSKYEFLPKTTHDQKLVAVDLWENMDDALAVVVRRIHELIRKMQGPTSPLPAANETQKAVNSARPNLSDLERKGFEAELELATLKLQHLRKALLIETNPSVQFQLEQQIGELEKRLGEIKSRLTP